ncbi:hypothetical protein FSARC_14599 [Fusarium sarcochroum]|uniref:Uncharacterized protein n=1 Tax=Fusarium sarcochroum TaxID=1208366 RepID=A0A8H4SS52_9HYPO|nr:hypothetical protein FSARC_14599 [Fusarium sarcochroum]
MAEVQLFFPAYAPEQLEPEITIDRVEEDPQVVSTRAPNGRITRHSHLTVREKVKILETVQLMADATEPPITITIPDWFRMLHSIFEDWNASRNAPKNPTLPDRKFEHTHIEERDAIIDLKDNCRWDTMCSKCCLPARTRRDEDRISTIASEPITADDGIARDFLNPPKVFSSGTKRVKKNKQERQTILDKPQTQTSLVHNEHSMMIGPGKDIDCTFKPKCARCDDAPHITRNCPRNDDDRISTIAEEPITADDGVQRNVMDPPRSVQATAKRVKKNKAERQTSLAKPQTRQGLARSEYRGAMRKLHQQKEDSVTGGQVMMGMGRTW